MVARFSDPFDVLLNMQQVLDRSPFNDWLGLSTASRGAFPAVNVFQQDDNLMVIAEMPGMDKEQIDVSIKRNQLRISGNREIDYGDNVSVHRQQRKVGTFDRTFTLPLEVEADKVKAEYKNGLLTLCLPRADKDRAKQVAIA
jgi:HSP20 family protein